MSRKSKRSIILSAASAIILSQGVEKLTLEAVAKEAGISKGGLLHHFPNKQALIIALIKESSDRFYAELEAKAAKDPHEVGKWSRAYVDVTFNDDKKEEDLHAALTASLFTDPELLGLYRNDYFLWQKKIEADGIDPVRSAVVRLAVDGLWFAEIFGVGVPDKKLRDQVTEYLHQMTK